MPLQKCLGTYWCPYKNVWELIDALPKKSVNFFMLIQKSDNVLNSQTKKSVNLVMPYKNVRELIDAHTKMSGKILMP